MVQKSDYLPAFCPGGCVLPYDSIVRITEDFLYKTIEVILQHDAVAYFSDSHRGILKKLAGTSLDELHERVDWSYQFWNTAFQEENLRR